MRNTVLLLGVLVAAVAGAVLWAMRRTHEAPTSEDLMRTEARLLSGDEKGVALEGRARMTREDILQEIEESERAEVRDAGEVDLTITLPGRIPPPEREARYADPLAKALGKLGAVTGGGSVLEKVDGRMVITACDIEVTAFDVEKALPILRESLKKTGAPKGTTITRHQPRESVHPLWPD